MPSIKRHMECCNFNFYRISCDVTPPTLFSHPILNFLTPWGKKKEQLGRRHKGHLGEGRGSAVELATQGSQVGKKARLNTQHRGHWGKKARKSRRHRGHWGKKSAIEQVTREVLAKTSKQTKKKSYLFPPPPPIYVYIYFSLEIAHRFVFSS